MLTRTTYRTTEIVDYYEDFGERGGTRTLDPMIKSHHVRLAPPTKMSLFGTIDAHALADVHAQRIPAAVDPDVIGVFQKCQFGSWVHGAILTVSSFHHGHACGPCDG